MPKPRTFLSSEFNALVPLNGMLLAMMIIACSASAGKGQHLSSTAQPSSSQRPTSSTAKAPPANSEQDPVFASLVPDAGAPGGQAQAAPRIGINAELDNPSSADLVARRVEEAGGIAIRLNLDADLAHFGIDGLVLTGGKDINPSRYGEARDASTTLISAARDSFDFKILDEVLKAKAPILGICLGGQELWVAAGGRLIQDIPSEIGKAVNHRARESGHWIELKQGS